MSADEYVPSELAVELADEWLNSHRKSDTWRIVDMLRDEVVRLAAHDARVRRDAAREALDGLIGALNTSVHEIQNGPTPNPVAWQTGALWTRDLAKIRRDTEYPEETP